MQSALCYFFLSGGDKPRDIHESTLLIGEEALDIYVSLAQFDAERSGLTFVAVHHSSPPLDECLEVACPKTFTVRFPLGVPHLHSRHPGESLTHLDITAAGIRYKYLKLRDTYWRMSMNKSWANFKALKIGDHGIAVTITGHMIRRLMRLYHLIRTNPTLHSSLTSLERHPQLNVRHGRISNWSLNWDNITGFFGVVQIGPACYSTLHLTKFAGPFPSQAEALMWRAACATILVTVPWYHAIFGLIIWWDRMLKRPEPLWIFSCLLLLSSLWYILCRAFIVVESFIMLAHIPDTALHVPAWATYIPSFK
jgi:hypothetical protein